MAAYSGPVDDARAISLDQHLQHLVVQVEQAEHQGVPLETRDYAALAILTVVVPILLTVWGVIAS